ncbi:hypothetical protein JCM12141A_53060 [Mycolicibacterium hodleri]
MGTPVAVGAVGDDEGTSAQAIAATISPHSVTSVHRPRRLTRAPSDVEPLVDYIITPWRAVGGKGCPAGILGR